MYQPLLYNDLYLSQLCLNSPLPPPSNMTWLNDEMAGQTDAGEDESEIASWDVRVERRGE